MTKISVIVPVYNVEPYIHRCVDSILNQTFTDFELILVDDGSPDNCGEICDEYAKKDNRIYVIHQENGGLSAARNAGIDWAFANSNSEWVTFIDSDDWVHKQYLELLYNAATLNDAEVSCCGFTFVSDYITETTVNFYEVKCGNVEELFTAFKNYNVFNLAIACCRLYKKYLFSNIKFPLGKLHEDEYVTYKILFLCKNIAVVRESLYYYFRNNFGIMHSKLSVKRIKDTFNALQEQIYFFYDHKSKILFEKTLYSYFYFLSLYYKEYKKDKACLKELKSQTKSIKFIIRKHKHYLPDHIKKQGINKWIKNQLHSDDIKKDFLYVKSEKGIIYSFIWLIKTKIESKFNH